MSISPKFEIEVRSGDSQSSSTVMKDTFVIGRAPTCDVVIDHPQVSREHIRVEYKNEKLYIIDLGSSHGSSINGKTLTAKKSYPHSASDELILAKKAAKITINQISKPQPFSIQPELSSPDFSMPEVPSIENESSKVSTPHFFGNTGQPKSQLLLSRQNP